MSVELDTINQAIDLGALRAQAEQGMAIAYWAGLMPGQPAVIAPDGRRTYGELNGRANQLVRALRRRGVPDGAAVALLSRNRVEFAEVYAACLRAGWRLTFINFHLTAAEAGYIVRDCEAVALVVDGGVAPEKFDEADLDAVAVRLSIGEGPAGFDDYEAALAGEDTGDISDPSPGQHMLYTSGTTGRPNGVAHATPQSPAVPDAGLRPGQTHLVTGPLYHAAPVAFGLHAGLAWGQTIVLMDTWTAEETLRLIAAHRVTHSHLVATMFHRLLALPDEVRAAADTSSLVFVIHGAAPCPVHVKQRMIDWWGPIIWEYYSATEGTGTLVDPFTWQQHPGTVGKPMPEGQVIVGDDDANPLPANEVGTVWIRSPQGNRFHYFNNANKTDESYRGEYFTLGDVGYLDDDGFLYLTDRSVNLIISGGVNIYPAEVDAVLLAHPAVADAAVIGIPDTEWGEAVHAVVELHDGVADSDALRAELLAWCRDSLAHFKCPRSVDVVEALPRLENGKIYKRLLRDAYRSS